jgi:hypothetical protein
MEHSSRRSVSSAVASVRRGDHGALVSALTGLADARSRIVAAGGWVSGPSTTMGVLELMRSEVYHCRMLRWVLDPLGRHGVGTAMIGALADEAGILITDHPSVRIAAEVPGERSRADLVLTVLDGHIPLVIEAKIDSGEGERQAERLELDWPNADRLVFLTVEGGRLPSTARQPARWRALSWEWVAMTTSAMLADLPAAQHAGAAPSRQVVAEWVSVLKGEVC